MSCVEGVEEDAVTGVWMGVSIPHDADRVATRWIDCRIRSWALETPEEVLLLGMGQSVWKGQHFYFSLSGRRNLGSGLIQIVKKHTSRETVYFCSLSEDKQLIEGRYDKGTLRLERVMGLTAFVPANRFSGNWIGKSYRESSGQVTEWKEIKLEFGPCLEFFDSYSIQGKGISLWNGEELEFSIEGIISLDEELTFRGNLLKLHQSIQSQTKYEVCFYPDKHVISGTYGKDGKVNLSKVFESSLDNEESSIEKYCMFLQGFLIAKPHLSEEHLKIMKDWREANSISESAHQAAFSRLGLSLEVLPDPPPLGGTPSKSLKSKQKSGSLLDLSPGYVAAEKESKNCVICLEREWNTVLLPCGHLGLCQPCSTEMSACPFCRKPIEQARLVFAP